MELKFYEAASGRIKGNEEFGRGCLRSQALRQAEFSTANVGNVTLVLVLPMRIHSRVRIPQKSVSPSIHGFVLTVELSV